MGASSSGERMSEKGVRRYRLVFLLGVLVCIGLGITAIIMANSRTKELFDLLDTYPGKRHLYLGHDLCTGFSAFGIALGIFALVFYVFYEKFQDDGKSNHQPLVQVFLIFAFIILSVLLLAAGLVVLWSANAQNGEDEHRWSDDYPLAWKHSASWDWMTQTFYYEYGNLWRNLISTHECCGVRGPHEIGAIRALWTNRSDIFSSFNEGTNGAVMGENLCCKETATLSSTVDATNWAHKCLTGEIYYSEGCYWKVAWPEFIPLGSVAIVFSAIAMCVSIAGTHFYLQQFPSFFPTCCKIRC